MKNVNQNELDLLNKIKEDVSITLEGKFSSLPSSILKNITSLSSILVSLYFKALNHDPKNKSWKNRDMVIPMNNYVNIVKNVVEIHAGYNTFSELEKYLLENSFSKVENTLSEAIGNYFYSKDQDDLHHKYYFPIMAEGDVLSNFPSLLFISQNKIHQIITIIYTNEEKKDLNEENKLTGRLINLGFDTLVIDGNNIEAICDAIVYAKKLNKSTIILANINN